MKVAEVMSTELVTVTPVTPLKQAANVMVAEGVSGLPVVDPDGALVGIITEADYLSQEAARDRLERHRLLDVLFGDRGKAVTGAEVVGDVMTTEPVTVASTDLVAHAARIMVDRKVKRLPVTDEGVLVGIVSRADVLSVFTRPDDAIAGELLSMIDRGLLPVSPSEVSVRVEEGTVSLSGTVETRIDASVLADLASRIDGVIGVHNDLEWRVDTRRPEQDFPGYPQEGSRTVDSGL